MMHVRAAAAAAAAAAATAGGVTSPPVHPVMQEVVVGEGHAAQLGDALGVRVLGWQLPHAPRPSAAPLGEQVSRGPGPDSGPGHRLQPSLTWPMQR